MAGTFLALRLAKAQIPVVVYAGNLAKSASDVAAGLYNVATGLRAALTWNADVFLDALDSFFADPFFSAFSQYLHKLPIYRPLPDAHAFNDWCGKSAQAEYGKYISIQTTPLAPQDFINPYGGIWIHNCGWLDVPQFLQAAHIWLQTLPHVQWLKQELDYAHVHLDVNKIQDNNHIISYRNIVFAEGLGVNQNPYRTFAPIIPLKGETLLVSISNMPQLKHIVTGGIYVLPQQDNTYLVGATYERDFTVLGTSDVARVFLVEKLRALFPQAEITILNQYWGLRPTTIDRRPIIGQHPIHKTCWFLNGFGTKGVLQAPYFSQLIFEGMGPSHQHSTYVQDKTISPTRKNILL